MVKKLGSAGDFVDAAVAAGANEVSGPNLIASDQDGAYRNALKAAMSDARLKAETLAGATGSSLGKITAVVETSSNSGPMPLASAKDSAVSIEPGTQKVEASVSVTYAIGP
jgi:uncharacterized protein YggE